MYLFVSKFPKKKELIMAEDYEKPWLSCSGDRSMKDGCCGCEGCTESVCAHCRKKCEMCASNIDMNSGMILQVVECEDLNREYV